MYSQSANNYINFSDFDLIQLYINKLISKDISGSIMFDPWFILEDTTLLKTIIQRLALKLQNEDINGICILGNSGIPMGTWLAIYLGLPFYIYRKEPFEIDNLIGEHPIFPIPPENSKLALVDSHVNRGFTSSSCSRLLCNQRISVKCLVTPVSFLDIKVKNNRTYHPNIPLIHLVNGNDYEKLLLELFEVEIISEAIKCLQERKRIINDIEEGKELKFSPERVTRFEGIIRSFFLSDKKIDCEELDKDLGRSLRNIFSSDESEVWNFLCARPILLKETCEKVNSIVGINKFSLLVGTHILGTLFALSLAWYCDYSGKVHSTYKPNFINKRMFEDNIEEALLISGRIRTGVFIRAAVKALEASKIRVDKALVLRLMLEEVKFPRNYMVYDQLKKAHCKILQVS